MLIPWNRVPRPRALLGAILAHLLLFVLAFPFFYTGKVRLIRPKHEVVQVVPRHAPLAYGPQKSAMNSGRRSSGVRMRPNKTTAVAKLVLPVGKGEPSLGERARKATKELMANFQFSLNYGFNPNAYSFANQTHGQIPRIEAHEVPYEQYVIVEVTVDVDGTVAEARVVTGRVPSHVEQKLISAIREFRYDPAKRDGVAIPSLLDIVIHVPS
jgi:TonB family protein